VTGIAKKITLTEKQCDVLSQIVTSRTHRLDHIERAQIILLSSALKPNVQISQKLSISISTVKKWRNRWLKNEEKLLLVDEKEKGINYVRKILEILSDEQRSGAPSTFTAEQVCQREAILREKRIKKWNRQWKINLIEQNNPHWINLSIGLC
jgi:transposase